MVKDLKVLMFHIDIR